MRCRHPLPHSTAHTIVVEAPYPFREEIHSETAGIRPPPDWGIDVLLVVIFYY